MTIVNAVTLTFKDGFYEISYWHGTEITLVDRSDDEVGHDYEQWESAARQHARDMGATFLDLTMGGRGIIAREFSVSELVARISDVAIVDL